MSDVEPYRLLGEGELEWLRVQALQQCAAWASEWLPAVPTLQVLLAASVPAGTGEWVSAHAGAAGCHLTIDALPTALFGLDAAQALSPVAAEVARRAGFELARRLLPDAAQSLAGTQAPGSALLRRGAGTFACSIAIGGAVLQAVANAAAVTGWLARRPAPARVSPMPKLAELPQAVREGRVRLEAWAGAAEIDVATLQALAVGDVIPLDLRADQPLTLTIDGRPAAHRAFLGSSGAHRALRLAAPSRSAHSNLQEPLHGQ